MEKFNAATIAHVTGFTVSTVNSWASKNNKSVKDGLSVLDIVDFLHAPKREAEAGKVDEKSAARLKTALEVMGELKGDYSLEG